MATTLLRNHLGRALVDGVGSSYFSKAVVGRLAQTLDFQKMGGNKDYRRVLHAHYADSSEAWLTPVEIFAPHYAEAIGRSMLSRHRATFGANEPLRICEVGGGTGTAVVSLLSWLQRTSPADYERCQYLLLEPSAHFAQVQAARLRDAGVGAERARVVHAPASDWHEALGGTQEGGWSLLLLEVLDNLPHDKLRLDLASGVLLETHVEPAPPPAADDETAEGGTRLHRPRGPLPACTALTQGHTPTLLRTLPPPVSS